VQPDRQLDIPHDRTCECPPGHINCLDAKTWLKRQIGVWQFYYESDDIRDKSLHPAAFPLSLARQVIELFSHEGELVLDPFVGSGTTLLAAWQSGRNSVGFDLNPEYIALTRKRMDKAIKTRGDPSGGAQSGHCDGEARASPQYAAVCDDALNVPYYLSSSTVACVFTSPPYANLLNRRRKNKSRRGDQRHNEQFGRVEQYSQHPRDLGTMGIDEFIVALSEVFAGILPLLRPRAHCVINVADMWWKNTRIPIHKHVIEGLEAVGYEFRNTIIWDRTNIVNRVGIFGWPSNYITMGVTYEYLLDFWKPDRERMEQYEKMFGERAVWDSRSCHLTT